MSTLRVLYDASTLGIGHPGLSALEAMQCGTPVVASNTSSLPEVGGDAGILVDPRDGDALCQAMLEVCRDTGAAGAAAGTFAGARRRLHLGAQHPRDDRRVPDGARGLTRRRKRRNAPEPLCGPGAFAYEVEATGIEPVTSCLQSRRSPS
jgi:hypothetical protein